MTSNLTLADIIRVTGHSRQTVWRMRRNRLLPFEVVGGIKHFTLADVIAVLREFRHRSQQYERALCAISNQRLEEKAKKET